MVPLESMTANVSTGWGEVPPAPCFTAGTSTAVDVSGDNGTYYSGDAAGWYLSYWSPGTGRGAELLLFVLGSAVYDFGELLGGNGCGSILSGVALSSELIDSTTAASAAVGTASGAAYIAANPRANATYVLAESLSQPAFWGITFDACTGGTTETFTAGVYATNGTVTSSSAEFLGLCGG